jgi:hypothetical protein
MCNIEVPHTYYDPSPIPPHRSNVPIVYIYRFNPDVHPYPKMNIWEVIEGVPERLDQTVYIYGYGELRLSDVSVEVKDKDWRMLSGHTLEGRAVVLLALKKEKKEKKSLQTINRINHLLSVFTSCISI